MEWPSHSTLISLFMLVVVVALVALRRRLTAAKAAPRHAAPASLPNLVGSPPPRPAMPLHRQSLAGIGTIELPTGSDWEQAGNRLYHDELGLVIVIQNQKEGMAGYEKVYLDSYNDVNIRDAPAWQRGPEVLGQVDGITAARTTGRFNNGTAMVTRDYIFFAENNTIILQSRVPAAHAASLDLLDYLASTFRRG
jgi:hypothetical protein